MWNDARMGERAANWIGMPALRAPRVKHEIVEIPENEIAVAFIHPKAVAVFRIELDQHLAVEQQSEQIEVQGGRVAAKLADLLGLRQGREGGSDGGIANPEQRPGARRFQHHLVAAPAQIGEARQHDGITVPQLCRLRPVFGDLRLDDHEVLLFARRG
ncbi:sRNA-binding carbon storage regulator CsrA [Bradyrhizobium sp. USDA 3256]